MPETSSTPQQAAAPNPTPPSMPRLDPRDRLDTIVEMMLEMSTQTDPQEMVRRYAARIRPMFPSDGFISISRRGIDPPKFRITRSDRFERPIDPWRESHMLPVLSGGLLGELLYEGKPRIVSDFCPMPDDPAFRYIEGMRSFAAIPHYDGGQALNMVVQMSRSPDGFDEARFPEAVWMSNLFGRATGNLVLSRRLKEALDALDHELRVVADMQRSLLPRVIPRLRTMKLVASYQTSKWAGGDYYDFFDLGDGKWGILIADVAGHGTPAAVLMAVLHALAHQMPRSAGSPREVLAHMNRELCLRYTTDPVSFITAFYGIYDDRERSLVYANAGHPAPIRRNASTGIAGAISSDQSGIPLGIDPDAAYQQEHLALAPRDTIAFFTDGITEARATGTELFGERRLAEIIANAPADADETVSRILTQVRSFTLDAPPTDDRTLVVGVID